MKPANASRPAAPHAAAAAPQAGKSRAKGPRLPDASREAKRVAAALLEVLAGAATPAAAAATLGVSLPRFYLLEGRAMQAFVAACEPRAGGRTLAPVREIDLLRQQVERCAPVTKRPRRPPSRTNTTTANRPQPMNRKD